MITNPFVDKAAQLLAQTSYECSEAPDRFRAMASRLEEARLLVRPVETVRAAYPVQVRRAGLMVELDASALVKALVRELADQFAEDPVSVGDQLAEIARLAGEVEAEHTLDGRAHAEHALGEKLDELLDELGGAEQHLTSEAAWKLGHLLIERAGPRVPRQQDRDAA